MGSGVTISSSQLGLTVNSAMVRISKNAVGEWISANSEIGNVVKSRRSTFQSESKLPVRPFSGISPAIFPITRPGQAYG